MKYSHIILLGSLVSGNFASAMEQKPELNRALLNIPTPSIELEKLHTQVAGGDHAYTVLDNFLMHLFQQINTLDTTGQTIGKPLKVYFNQELAIARAFANAYSIKAFEHPVFTIIQNRVAQDINPEKLIP